MVCLKKMLNGEIIFYIKRIGAGKNTCGLVVFININTYILAELYLQSLWTVFTYLLKNVEIELNMRFW